MNAKVILQISSGPLQGAVFSFDRHDTFLFGRHSACHARLPKDGWISRHQFLLEVNPPDARVRDLGSQNGTYVNGVKYGGREARQAPEAAVGRRFPEVDLKHGDRIVVGQTTITVRVEVTSSCLRCGAPLPLGGTAVIAVDALCANCAQSPEPQGLRTLFEPQHEFMPPGAPRQPASDGRPTIEGYELGAELGRGGMGLVYRAVRKHDSVPVAVKVMLPKIAVNEARRREFLREVEVTRQIGHPNVVRLLESGDVGGAFFCVMDFCSEGSVDQLLARRGGRLPENVAVPIVLQCLDGLRFAHERNFVHRDLKPQNILLDRQAGTYTAKIADFGLAKCFSAAGFSGMTATGAFAGTFQFMPREQLTDFKYARPVSDLWSLAATLYFLLCGEGPIDFASSPDPIQVLLNADPVPLQSRLSSVSRALAEVVDRGLAMEPGKRFQSATEFKEALRQAVGSTK